MYYCHTNITFFLQFPDEFFSSALRGFEGQAAPVTVTICSVKLDRLRCVGGWICTAYLSSERPRDVTAPMGHVVKITTGKSQVATAEAKSVILEEPKLGFVLVWLAGSIIIYDDSLQLPNYNILKNFGDGGLLVG